MKKSVYVIVVIVVLIAVSVTIYLAIEARRNHGYDKQTKEKTEEKKEKTSNEKISKEDVEKKKQEFKKTEKLRLKASQYRKRLDDKSVFPDVYFLYLIGKHKGLNKENLRDKVKENIIFSEGRFRYAFDKGYGFTKKEGGKEVERFLSEFKKADNFKKDYGNIYKELGITARELYNIEKISILKNETIIKYEKKEISDLKEYKKIKKKILTDFKKTNYWKTIEKAIDRTFDLLQKNPKPTLAEIKEANLDVYKSPYKD